MDSCQSFVFTFVLDVLVTACPHLANGLPLGFKWLAVVVGQSDSSPRHLVENLMVCDARTLGLQDSKNVILFRLESADLLHSLHQTPGEVLVFTRQTTHKPSATAHVKRTPTTGPFT